MKQLSEEDKNDIRALERIQSAVQAIIDLKSGKYSITEIFDLLEVINSAVDAGLIGYKMLRTDREELEKHRQHGQHLEAKIALMNINCEGFPLSFLPEKVKIVRRAIDMGATTWEALETTAEKFNLRIQALGLA